MKNETNVATRITLGGAALALALATQAAQAGSTAKTQVETPPANNGNWCEWLQNKPGTFYKNKDNPVIQEAGIFGRLQYQQAWIDGDADGEDFWYDSEGQFRRLRIGAYIKFLDYFQVKANADMVSDSRPSGGDLDFDYYNIYEAALTFNAQKAFNISSHSKFDISYGKSELRISEEVNTSSKKIKTIERSAIANKIFPTTLTGAWIDAKTGKFSYYLGAFSTADHEELGSWNHGDVFIAQVGYDFTSSTPWESAEAFVAFATADHDGASDSTVGFDWAGSAYVRIQQGAATYRANLIVGENRDDASSMRDGSFWGLVFLPTYWIVEDRLEAVFRYQYAHASSPEGIRLNSRYARNAGDERQEDIAGLRGGRGDEHHSIYLGLNYYFCGDNSKIMAGIEWDDISSDGHDVYEGFTYSIAYRMFF
jgi:hypothetical protein